ncbi:20046_t:CDS:2, partial [Entrophospora sp. SA101]
SGAFEPKPSRIPILNKTYCGLTGSYFDDQEILNASVLETDETEAEIHVKVTPSWDKWIWPSGISGKEALHKASSEAEHSLMPEKFNTIRCGGGIACPKWISEDDYKMIQSIWTPFVSCLDEEAQEFLTKIILNESGEQLMRIFLLVHCSNELVFPPNSVMSGGDASEASYGGFIIHPTLMWLLEGLESHVKYLPGEIALDCIDSCRLRYKQSDVSQLCDGVFKVDNLELAHLEMSGGHGLIDKPRSTWDHVKGFVGCLYMLDELANKFTNGNPVLFCSIKVFFLHTLEDRMELWSMMMVSAEVFLFERIKKVTVPVLFDDRDKLCDYLDLLWTFKIKLEETTEIIKKLRSDHISNRFNPSSMDLTDLIPIQPHIPQKDKDKKDVEAIRPTSLPHGTKRPFI